MAIRTSRMSVAPNPGRIASSQPPPYQTPDFPLNPEAQRALAHLTQTHSLARLDQDLAHAISALQGSAEEINDRLYAKEDATRKRKDREEAAGSQSAPDHDELDQQLREMSGKVDRMTQRMEEVVRKLIDGQHSVQHIKSAVNATFEDARAHASTQASTQHARSQRRTRAGTGGLDEEGDEGDDLDDQDFTPTDPTAGTQPEQPPLEKFRTSLENEKIRYQLNSLTSRYAENNDYRDFRRVVHDARHPDSDVALAHHSEWFSESGAPAPGVTTRARAAADDESDDDIAVARATISTKCPLTLQEFNSPLTSDKCPHSFESEAILSMIRQSNLRDEGPRGQRYVQCPVPGCPQKLTANDLRVQRWLVRRVKRMQRARELEEAEAEEGLGQGSTQRDAALIDDEDGEDVDVLVDAKVPLTQKMKHEPRGQQTQSKAGAGRAAPRSTQVVELESESEEAEEDDRVPSSM